MFCYCKVIIVDLKMPWAMDHGLWTIIMTHQQSYSNSNLDSGLAAIAGFCIIYVFTRHGGIGISPDSVAYVSGARNIIAHCTLRSYDQMPLVDFPAFYPLFLAAVNMVTRVDPLIYAPILNSFLFALVIYMSGYIMEGFELRSKLYKRILLSIIVLSPALLEVYSMIWSETLFIIWLLGFIIALRSYFKSRSFAALLLAALIASFSSVTRYAGITLIGTGGLLLIMDSQLRLPKKIVNVFVFGFGSTSLLIINLIHNYFITGNLTGDREKGITSFGRNLYYYGRIICDWLPFYKDHPFWFLCTSIVLVIVVVAGLLWSVKIRTNLYTYENISTTFFLIYSLFMVTSATLSRYEAFTSRLLSPIFIPLAWAASYRIPAIINKRGEKKRIAGLLLIAAIAISFQVSQLRKDYETFQDVKDAGIPGYTEDPWKQSEIAGFIKKNSSLFQKAYTIYSNAPDAGYFFSGLSFESLPQKIFPQEVADFYDEDDHYVVWFNEIDNTDLISLQEILLHKKMTCMHRFSDGAIYVYHEMPE